MSNPNEAAPVVVDVKALAAKLLAEADALDEESKAESEAAAAAEFVAAKPRPLYEVAPGRSVTTLRGLHHEGEGLEPEWFPGSRLGEKLRTLAGLVRDGFVQVNDGQAAAPADASSSK
jgi:hypothetical protein